MLWNELGAGEDITDLACHVTLQNHVIKGSSNFMGGSSLWYITTLASLVAIGIVLIEMFLVCYVIKQDHVIKGQVAITIRAPQDKSPPYQVWCP